MSDNQPTSGVDFLLAPFPDDVVAKRQGPGGKSFNYIPAEVMIRRLVDSGLEYSFGQVPGAPPEIVQHSNGVNVMLYYGRLHIPALGLPMDDVGTAFIHANGNEEQYKSAASDCLKRCARLYGIGLEMWEGDPNEATRGAPAPNYGEPDKWPQSHETAGPRQARTVNSYVDGESQAFQQPDGSGMTPKQYGFIKSLAKERNLDDTGLSQMVGFILGIQGKLWNQLDKREAGMLIEELQQMKKAPQAPQLAV